MAAHLTCTCIFEEYGVDKRIQSDFSEFETKTFFLILLQNTQLGHKCKLSAVIKLDLIIFLRETRQTQASVGLIKRQWAIMVFYEVVQTALLDEPCTKTTNAKSPPSLNYNIFEQYVVLLPGFQKGRDIKAS
jgi:hypothetical protein